MQHTDASRRPIIRTAAAMVGKWPGSTPHEMKALSAPAREMGATLSLEEAAAYLGMAPSTLRKRAAAGNVPGAKPGRRWMFRVSEIEAYRRPPRVPANTDPRIRAQRSERFAWHRASRRLRVPAWADRGAVAAFYHIARRASACTGLPFSVDHVLPMHGKTVSGLHVPENLRVLPRYLNQVKSNVA